MRDPLRQRTGEAFENGGLQQEIPYELGLAFEDLPSQEVQHVSMAAGERLDEARDVRVAREPVGSDELSDDLDSGRG